MSSKEDRFLEEIESEKRKKELNQEREEETPEEVQEEDDGEENLPGPDEDNLSESTVELLEVAEEDGAEGVAQRVGQEDFDEEDVEQVIRDLANTDFSSLEDQAKFAELIEGLALSEIDLATDFVAEYQDMADDAAEAVGVDLDGGDDDEE